MGHSCTRWLGSNLTLIPLLIQCGPPTMASGFCYTRRRLTNNYMWGVHLAALINTRNLDAWMIKDGSDHYPWHGNPYSMWSNFTQMNGLMPSGIEWNYDLGFSIHQTVESNLSISFGNDGFGTATNLCLGGTRENRMQKVTLPVSGVGVAQEQNHIRKVWEIHESVNVWVAGFLGYFWGYFHP